MGSTKGFTIVEVIIVIMIIGILVSIVSIIPTYFLVTSRDQERADDVASIARRLEQAYTAQEIGGPSYPSTAQLLTDIAGNTRTMKRLSSAAFQAPGSGTSNVIAATSNSTSIPSGAGTPTLNQYIYQPLVNSTSSAGLCTGTMTCVRFNLYYRREKDNSIQLLTSTHQQ